MHGERTSTKIWSCVLTLPTAERVQVDGEGRAAEEEEVTARVEMAVMRANMVTAIEMVGIGTR